MLELLLEQVEVSDDLHLRPYYGDEDDTNGLYHSEAKDGTTAFHAYAIDMVTRAVWAAGRPREQTHRTTASSGKQPTGNARPVSGDTVASAAFCR